MTQFTIRVVLHDNATWDDYIRLANALASVNVTDILTADDGTQYKMPPAEYQCHGELNASQVLHIVETAAKTVGKRYSVLVTQSAGRTWTGLERV